MKKVLINDGIHPDGQKLLEEAGFEVQIEKVNQEDLPEILPGFDAICVRSATKVPAELINVCPKLKVIGRGGVGLDNIDVSFAASKGVTVINTPAASSLAVAELVFAHIFSLARSMQLAHAQMPCRGITEFKVLKKSYSNGIQLRGKSIGIVGLGRIGQETARLALGLGMRVLAVDPFISEKTISLPIVGISIPVEVGIKTIDMNDMLSQSDFISLHVPGGDKAILGAGEFEKMKDGVIVINAARGGLIDEKALLEYLENGKIAGAGLDVFENEPMPNNKLLIHPNISTSPHIGASTKEAQRNIGLELAEKLIKELS